jgi:sugar (pentulose or hexulose) kinase
MYDDWADIAAFVDIGTVVEPDPAARDAVDEGYAIFRELYPALRPLMHRQARA